MNNFATLSSSHVSAKDRLDSYQKLSKACIEQIGVIPNSKEEFSAIESNWKALREEFPGVHNPSVPFYPNYLIDYMKNVIGEDTFNSNVEKTRERLWYVELKLKEYVGKPAEPVNGI